MSCELSSERETDGDRDRSPPTTSSPQTSRSTSRVLAQGSMSPSLDLRGGDNGESGGVEVQTKPNDPEPGEGHQETAHSVDQKKPQDSNFAAAPVQGMDAPSSISPPVTDGLQPPSSDEDMRQNKHEGAKAGDTESVAAQSATSGGSLGGKPSHVLKTTSEVNDTSGCTGPTSQINIMLSSKSLLIKRFYNFRGQLLAVFGPWPQSYLTHSLPHSLPIRGSTSRLPCRPFIVLSIHPCPIPLPPSLTSAVTSFRIL